LGTLLETNCGPRDFALLAYPDPKDLIINFDPVTREITVHAQPGFTQLGIHDYQLVVTLRDFPSVQLTLDLQVEIKHVCQATNFVQLTGEDIPLLLHEEK